MLSTDSAAEPALRSGAWPAFLADAVQSEDCLLSSDAARALLNMRSAAAANRAALPLLSRPAADE